MTGRSGSSWSIGNGRFCLAPDNGTGAGGSDGAPDWRQALPEDLRGHESLKDVRDVGALAKAFVDTKAFVGNSLRIPGPDAGSEDKKAFFQKLHEKLPQVTYLPEDEKELEAVEGRLWEKLGKPKDVKGYELPKDVDPQALGLNLDELRAAANTLGMTKKQFTTYVKGLAGMRADALTKQQAAQAAMKKEWGAAYDERVSAILEVAKKLGGEDIVAEVKAGRAPPSALKFLFAVTQAVGGEEREVGNQGRGGGAPTLTPDEAAQQKAEIMKRPEYRTRAVNPELHDALVRKVLALNELIVGKD